VRVPCSWLREIVEVGLPADELAELLTMGGLEVEAVERPTGGTRGVVVAEAITTGTYVRRLHAASECQGPARSRDERCTGTAGDHWGSCGGCSTANS
jgi:phenylalanyl-tRNA synthetase beta chain